MIRIFQNIKNAPAGSLFHPGNHTMKGKTGRYFLLLLILLIYFPVIRSQGQKDENEDILVLIQAEGVGSFYSDAIYSASGNLYVSVDELFKFLKIACTADKGGDQLRGFISDEKLTYSIDYKSATAESGKNAMSVQGGLLKQTGILFLEASLFEKIFGIRLDFDFSSLAISLHADFEFPVIKEKRLEQLRKGINGATAEEVPDTILMRRYHMFRPGMLDWSVMSSQTWNHVEDTRAGLGFGTELLGGEANVFLNYSTQYNFDNRLQQYYWRWVNNDSKVVRQIQAGKISTQTISSMYYPVVGVSAGNTQTSVRKAKGEYILSETTEPDWMVELYINGILSDFTKADASGLFTFRVPYVYGYTTLTLRFYGLMGEERSENRVVNIPYNFLPSGDFEYAVNGGVLQDGKNTPMGRGEASYGISNNLTVSGGVEYLGSLKGKKSIPFIRASFLPASRLMMSGEYDHGVRTRGLLDYYPWKNALLEIDYTKYVKGQTAIIFNYLEERKASFSVPVRIKSMSLFAKLNFQQNLYANFKYNLTELIFSAYYKQYSANLSAYANWLTNGPVYLNNNLAISVRLKQGFTVRPSAQFNLSQGQLLSFKTEIEKRFDHNGYLAVSYEYYKISELNCLNLTLKFDLSFAQANASTRISRKEVMTFQSLRGSIAFGNGGNHVITGTNPMTGRGGLSVIAFMDMNGNGIYDKNEHRVSNLNVKINGGTIRYDERDTITSIVGLEPFVNYYLHADDKDFDNISWKIKNKTYQVLVDPDQFKMIYIPVIAAGEIDGMVYLSKDSLKTGLGRIVVNIYSKDGKLAARTITESDGYVNWLGLTPGDYTVRIDSLQLERLGFSVSPSERSIRIRSVKEGDIVDGIDFVLTERPSLNKPAGISASDTLYSSPALSYDPGSGLPVGNGASDDQIHVSVGSTLNENDLFYLQAGAFNDKKKASAMAEKLRKLNLYAFDIIFEKGMYRIRVGYFKAGRDADEYKGVLTGCGLISFNGKAAAHVHSGDVDLSKGVYFVQAGAFRKEINAINYLRKVSKSIKFPAGITIEDGYYKIRLGYFKTEAEAMNCYKIMVDNNFQTFRSRGHSTR